MNLGQTLLNEDVYAVRHRRVSESLRQHREDYLALHGSCETAIVYALGKHGPMTKNLLFLAIPDCLPATVSRMANKMLRRGILAVDQRGPIELLRVIPVGKVMQ